MARKHKLSQDHRRILSWHAKNNQAPAYIEKYKREAGPIMGEIMDIILDILEREVPESEMAVLRKHGSTVHFVGRESGSKDFWNQELSLYIAGGVNLRPWRDAIEVPRGCLWIPEESGWSKSLQTWVHPVPLKATEEEFKRLVALNDAEREIRHRIQDELKKIADAYCEIVRTAYYYEDVLDLWPGAAEYEVALFPKRGRCIRPADEAKIALALKDQAERGVAK